MTEVALSLDFIGLKCPQPIIELARRIGESGLSGDEFSKPAWLLVDSAHDEMEAGRRSRAG